MAHPRLALAGGDARCRAGAEFGQTIKVVPGERFLDPEGCVGLEQTGSAKRVATILLDCEVEHDVDIPADRFAGQADAGFGILQGGLAQGVDLDGAIAL